LYLIALEELIDRLIIIDDLPVTYISKYCSGIYIAVLSHANNENIFDFQHPNIPPKNQ